jgi:hypothetical protein
VSAKLEERRAALRERERERERCVPFFFFERIGKIGGETRCTAGEGKGETEVRWFC